MLGWVIVWVIVWVIARCFPGAFQVIRPVLSRCFPGACPVLARANDYVIYVIIYMRYAEKYNPNRQTGPRL